MRWGVRPPDHHRAATRIRPCGRRERHAVLRRTPAVVGPQDRRLRLGRGRPAGALLRPHRARHARPVEQARTGVPGHRARRRPHRLHHHHHADEPTRRGSARSRPLDRSRHPGDAGTHVEGAGARRAAGPCDDRPHRLPCGLPRDGGGFAALRKRDRATKDTTTDIDSLTPNSARPSWTIWSCATFRTTSCARCCATSTCRRPDCRRTTRPASKARRRRSDSPIRRGES